MEPRERRPGRRAVARAAALALAACACALAAPAHAQPSIPVELFIGRLDFDSDFELVEQELVGARLGVDLNRFAGLRGFYWRGISGDRDEVAPIQAFGGEAQLNLNAGNGVTPFLVGGFGRLDFLDEYRNLFGDRPADRNFALAGGGLRLDVWRVGLQLSARSYLLQTEDGDPVQSEDVKSNLLLSAGVNFRLGGRGGRSARAERVPPPAEQVVRRGDTVYVVQQADPSRPDRVVTLPIPREGELYVRYGPVDTASFLRRSIADSVRARAGDLSELSRRVLAELEPTLREILRRDREELRDIVRAELQRAGITALTPEAEQRLLENLEARLAQRLREQVGAAPARVPADSARVVSVDTVHHMAAVDSAVVVDAERGFDPSPREVRVYAGGNVDRPRQFVGGVRLDLGPLDPARPALRLVPEAAVGAGAAGISVLLAGNLQYDFAAVRLGGAALTPYAYGGAGFLFLGDPPRGRAGTEAVVNLGYGVSAPLPNAAPDSRFFVEHQGVDLFDLNRVLAGVRFGL